MWVYTMYIFVSVCQDVPAWCVVLLCDPQVLWCMLAGLELSPVGFVCFWRLLFSIAQSRSEQWFSNHGNDLGGYGTLIIPSKAWFVSRHKIPGT